MDVTNNNFYSKIHFWHNVITALVWRCRVLPGRASMLRSLIRALLSAAWWKRSSDVSQQTWQVASRRHRLSYSGSTRCCCGASSSGARQWHSRCKLTRSRCKFQHRQASRFELRVELAVVCHLMQTCHSLTVSGIHIVRRCIVVAVSED